MEQMFGFARRQQTLTWAGLFQSWLNLKESKPTHTLQIWVLKLPTKMSQSTKLGESYFVDLLDPFTDRRMPCQKLRKPGIQGTFCLILQICCPPPPTDLSSVNPEKFQIRKSRPAWCDCFWFRKFVTIESSKSFPAFLRINNCQSKGKTFLWIR